MEKDKQMRQETEEAMEQINFQNKPNPITQDDIPVEIPVQPNPKIPAQAVQ